MMLHSVTMTRYTYSESLQVVHANAVAEQVEKSILEHASVTVPVLPLQLVFSPQHTVETRGDKCGVIETRGHELCFSADVRGKLGSDPRAIRNC